MGVSFCFMLRYFIKRLVLIVPTMIGLTLACFLITVTAPGGPIEQKLAQMKFAGMGQDMAGSDTGSASDYGVPQELVEALKKQYGFDKPLPIQYLIWLKNAVTFDFGESFIYEEPVTHLILERVPISLQFGLISMFLTYLISIIVGIRMAVKKGAYFDVSTSVVLIVLYSLPSLLLAILFKVFLAGRLDLFPIGDLYSDMYFEKDFFGRVLDRIHHFILPMLCYIAGSFTVLTLFVRNNFLDEMAKDYVRTAQAKGLGRKSVLYKHTLRNALVPLATGLSSIFGVFLAGSLIIEKIFNINGIGLLAYDSAFARDYNVIMALIFIQSLIFLVGRLLSDFAYVLIDPRIDFA